MASRRGIFREGLKLCGRRPSPPALFHERTDRYSSPAALRSREGGVIADMISEAVKPSSSNMRERDVGALGRVPVVRQGSHRSFFATHLPHPTLPHERFPVLSACRFGVESIYRSGLHHPARPPQEAWRAWIARALSSFGRGVTGVIPSLERRYLWALPPARNRRAGLFSPRAAARSSRGRFASKKPGARVLRLRSGLRFGGRLPRPSGFAIARGMDPSAFIEGERPCLQSDMSPSSRAAVTRAS